MFEKFFNSSHLNKKFLWGVLFLLLLVRLYQINGPIVDYQSWNQVSAAAMAKHLYWDWTTLWAPKVDVYATLENTSQVYAQEFLLYHIPVALIYHLVGIAEWPGRVVSIAWGMLGLWVWYLLIRRRFGEQIAILTLLFTGLSPLIWYYQRTIMADAAMLTAMILGVYYFEQWLDQQTSYKYLGYALLWTIFAGLFKVFGLVVGVTYLLMIVFRKEYPLLKDPKLYGFAILAWLPTLVWIYHVIHLEEGITEFTDNNSMNQIRHPELLLTWNFYNRLIFSRIIDQGLTPWVAIFAIIGLFSCSLKDRRYHLPLAWLGGSFTFLIITQRGNYVHDYYQIFFIPGLTVFAAIGVQQVWRWQKPSLRLRKWWLGIFLLLFLLHSTKYAYNRFQVDIGSFHTGQKVAQLSTHPQELVLAFDKGVMKKNQLIYYSEHAGWHTRRLDLARLEAYRAKGAKWLAVNLKVAPHYQNYQVLLEQIATQYPKVWEAHSVDRYQLPVISQIYDLQPF